jgi:hypothetical protein
LTFQIFFLAIARVQLQYAAFYAARAGAVHGGDIQIMEDTASRILAVSPSLSSFRPGSLKVNVTDPGVQEISRSNTSDNFETGMPLTVHLTWEYPLILPLANRLFGKSNSIGLTIPVSTVQLQASWTMEMLGRPVKGKNNDV